MENSQTDKYICVLHGHDACPDCAMDFIKINNELSRYKKAWEDLRDTSEGKIHEYAVAALEGKDMKQWLKEKK